MKVKVKTKDKISFGDAEPGTCFQTQIGDVIVFEKLSGKMKVLMNDGVVNALRYDDGSVTRGVFFYDNSEIFPCEVEMIVRYK